MNRILGVFLVLGAIMFLPVAAWSIAPEGTSQPNGVYCEINGVKLFAQSAEDCAKAQGNVTHTVTTTVTPANPDQEPEIQRTKDKEPVAP